MTNKPWMTQTLAVLCALALFPACAKKKDEKKTEQPAIETPKLVTPGLSDTDYMSKCEGAGGMFAQELLRFTETQGMRKIMDHSSNNCTAPTATARVEFTYKIGAHVADRVFELDIVETAYYLTAESPTIAALWSRNEKCGIRSWTPGREEVVRKGPNCEVAGDSIDRRPVYTVLKKDGDVVFTNFDVSNRDQNGLLPAQRISKLSGVAYTKVPRNPTPAPGPQPIGSCPALAQSYACGHGNLDWEGQNLLISTQAQPAMISVTRTKNGVNQINVFEPGAAARERTLEGRRFVTVDTCEGGVLKSVLTVSRLGDTRNREITETSFRIDERQNLRVTTLEKRVINNVEDGGVETPTACEKR